MPLTDYEEMGAVRVKCWGGLGFDCVAWVLGCILIKDKIRVMFYVEVIFAACGSIGQNK